MPPRGRIRLLDLYCGAGGAAMGYHRAGFDVVGVDIRPQPRYPFEFHQADALEFPLDGFDVIHASPPCQAWSKLRTLHPGREYPDLIEATRARLESAGCLYVIENVPGAPLIAPKILCGSMFGLGVGGRYLKRHRAFESNGAFIGWFCKHEGRAIGVYGNGGGTSGTMARVAEAAEAMGIDWMTRPELSQAIPPAYTEHIGRQLKHRLHS